MWRSALVSLALLPAVACAANDGRGQIMVVVTSDLVVPTDLDWLDWSVTLEGESEPYAGGSTNLVETGLPATLAIRSGPATNAPVRIELAARRGGRQGAIAVIRSARVEVPNEGVRELPMPLSFLCSAGGRHTECPPGETCEFGACVPELVEDARALSEYQVPRASSCFDTLACFPSIKTLRIGRDLPDGGCEFNGTDASPAPQVNVALQVNTSLVGNFGACRSEPESCLVPVPHEGPAGWSAPEGASDVIQLPAPACEALRSEIATLTISGLTRECSRLVHGTPLCQPEEVCVTSEHVCPPSFGDSWTGFSCSGEAGNRPELKDCYRPALDPGQAPAAHGLYCCPGAEQPSDEERDPLLIDDMTQGPQLKLSAPEGFMPGYWWTSVSGADLQANATADSSSSGMPGTGLMPAPGSIYRYRDIPPVTAEDTGIQITRAACLGSPDGFRGELAMQGFDLLKVRPTPSKGSANGPLDIDAYAGIRFHAMALNRFPALGEVGPDILVMFPNSETSRSGQCELSAVDCNDFRKTVTLSPTWTEYRVYFDELRQAEGGSGQPFTGDLFSIIFAVEGREQDRLSQPFDFCVSQIYFLEEKSE